MVRIQKFTRETEMEKKPVKLINFQSFTARKPKEISAIQFTKDNLPEGVEWQGDSNRGTWAVKTNHGLVGIEEGDWIIKTEAGEFYPCTDKEFQKLYKKNL